MGAKESKDKVEEFQATNSSDEEEARVKERRNAKMVLTVGTKRRVDVIMSMTNQVKRPGQKFSLEGRGGSKSNQVNKISIQKDIMNQDPTS